MHSKTFLTAIPLTALTATWSRRTTLVLAMAGFAVANTVTAVTDVYLVSLAARFLAGVAAGLAWALLAGYARRLAPGQEGRAIAVAMVGIPIALALGVPAGTFIGQVFDWRIAFGIITGLAVAVTVWILVGVPGYPGETQRGSRPPMTGALRVPGVSPVLLVTLVLVLGHTVLYAYIAEYVAWAGLEDSVDGVLLAFGVACLLSIWAVGRYIDSRLRVVSLACAALISVAFIKHFDQDIRYLPYCADGSGRKAHARP